MMYRSEWADTRNQEVILGIWLKRSAFEDILSQVSKKGKQFYKHKKENYNNMITCS